MQWMAKVGQGEKACVCLMWQIAIYDGGGQISPPFLVFPSVDLPHVASQSTKYIGSIRLQQIWGNVRQDFIH